MRATLSILAAIEHLPGDDGSGGEGSSPGATKPGWSGSPAVDQAILAAIDLADPAERGDLVAVLLDRGQPRGLVGIVRRFHTLPGPVQGWLRDRANELAAGLRLCIAADSRQTRANALELISPGRFAPLASLAAAALGDVDKSLVNSAAAALSNFVQNFLAEPQPADPGSDSQSSNVAQPPSAVTGRQLGSIPAEGGNTPGGGCATWRLRRRQIASAVRDALGSFAAHQRLAVLDWRSGWPTIWPT